MIILFIFINIRDNAYATVYAWMYFHRGLTRAAKQEHDKAIADYNEAIWLAPQYTSAYYNRGNAWAAKQEHDKALADYDEAIRLDPKSAPAYTHRGNAWCFKQEYDKALADYDEAIRLDPKSAPAYTDRGFAWYAKQEYDKALADYDEAIRLDPKWAPAYIIRALLQATCPEEKHRDGKRAVESATRACELTDWKAAFSLETLAAAYAECGDFAHAVEYQEKAQGSYKDEKGREKGRDRLALYREKKPYRQPYRHVPEAK